MLAKFARLFTIKTRFEAYLVIYALALGACERGKAYLMAMPGTAGWLLALACTGVVFIAGAKILDSVKPQPVAALRPQRRDPAAMPRRANRRQILSASVRLTDSRPRASRRAG